MSKKGKPARFHEYPKRLHHHQRGHLIVNSADDGHCKRLLNVTAMSVRFFMEPGVVQMQDIGGYLGSHGHQGGYDCRRQVDHQCGHSSQSLSLTSNGRIFSQCRAANPAGARFCARLQPHCCRPPTRNAITHCRHARNSLTNAALLWRNDL